jgi:integrase
MAKPKKPMKGVSCVTRKGVEYWYANLEGQKKYCGKGDKGYKIATAAKAKSIAKGYENKEVGAGLKVKKVVFKNVTQMSNWYMTLAHIQELGRYNRKLSLIRHILDYFGNKPINQVEADDMERYREHRRGQEAAHGTIDLELGVLRAMYNLALKRKKISADDMPGEFVLRNERNPRRIITDDEFNALLKHANDDFRDLFICAHETAMRQAEMCKLTASQVRLNIQHISGEIVDYIDLGIFDTKNKTRRTVPVSPQLKQILERRLEGLSGDDLVFTNQGQKFYPVLIRLRLQSCCEKAKVPYGDKLLNKKGERIGIVFHCFRHTRTTKWVEMGFSDEIIRRATGHKSLEAYRNYVKLDPNAVMRLVKDSKTDNSGTKLTQSL